jgi:hypothetical protein
MWWPFKKKPKLEDEAREAFAALSQASSGAAVSMGISQDALDRSFSILNKIARDAPNIMAQKECSASGRAVLVSHIEAMRTIAEFGGPRLVRELPILPPNASTDTLYSVHMTCLAAAVAALQKQLE